MPVVDAIFLWLMLGALTACIVGMNSTNRGNLPWTLAIGITLIWPLFWIKWVIVFVSLAGHLLIFSVLDAFRALAGKEVKK